MLQGYNATIFAYGQTGTGKTHTMIGATGDQRGVIPRAAHQILQHVSSDPTHTYSVQVSFLQLYMEMLQDLLEPSKDTPIRIREDPEEGVYLSGIRWVPVSSVKECMDLMALGDRHRNTAFTSMNSHSSRSHAAFMIKLEKRVKYSREKLEELERNGEMPDQTLIKSVLYLVDLAGSERVKKSKAVGSRLDEAKNINLALLALGNCIQALADKKAKFVPFRDSKLTRLLEDSLGGNSKTSLIVTIGPSAAHTNETISSLLFGSRAMKVENRPEVNKIVDYRAMCSQLQAELDQVNDGHSEYLIHNQQLLKEVEELRAMVEKLQAEKEELMTVLEDVKRQMESKGSVDVSAIEAQKKLELQRIQQHYQSKVQKQDEEHRKFLEEIDKLILDQEKDSAQMKTQISQHKNEKAKLTKELGRLQSELERERTDRDSRIAQMTQEMDDLRVRLSSAEEDAITQKGINAKLNTALQEKESGVKSLSVQLDEVKHSANTEIQSLKQQLQMSLEDQKKIKLAAVEKKKEWEAKVKASVEDMARNWQGKLEDLKTEAGQKIAAKEQEKREIDELLKIANGQITEKDANLMSLRSDFDSKSREVVKIVHVSESLKQELDKVMKSYESLKSQLVESKNNLTAKESEYSELMRKCMQRDEQLEDCLRQVRDREQKLANLTVELESVIHSSNITKEQLEEKLQKMSKEHESVTSEIIAKFAGQINRLNTEGQRQVAEMENSERKHKSVVETMTSRHSSDVLDLKSRFESERRKLTEEYHSNLQSSESRHKSELSDLQKRADSDIESLKRQLQMLSKDSDSKVEDLREELVGQRNFHAAEMDTVAKQHIAVVNQVKAEHQTEISELKTDFAVQLMKAEGKFEGKSKEMVKKHAEEIEELRRDYDAQIRVCREKLESYKSESAAKVKSMEIDYQKAERQHSEDLRRQQDENSQLKSGIKSEVSHSEKLKMQLDSAKTQISDLQAAVKSLKQRELELIQKQQQELAYMHEEHTQSTRDLESKHASEKTELEKYWEAQVKSINDLHGQQTERSNSSHTQTVNTLNRKIESITKEKDDLKEKAKTDDLRREEMINSLRQSQQSLMDSLSELERKTEEEKKMHETQCLYLQGTIESLTLKLHQEREHATAFECQVDVLKMEKAQSNSELTELHVKLDELTTELLDLQSSHDDELRELYEAARLRGEEHETACSDYQRAVSWYLVVSLSTEVELRCVAEELEEAQNCMQTTQETSFSTIKSLEDTLKTSENASKSHIADLQTTINGLKKEKEDCARHIESLQSRLQGKEIELKGLEAQLDATRDTSLTQSAELSGRLKELQKSITGKELEMHTIRTELQSSKERSSALLKKQSEDVMRLESTMSAKDTEIGNLTLELDKLKESNNAQIVKATERLTHLQQSLRAKDNELSQIALNFKRAEDTANSQAEELVSLRRNLTSSEGENRQMTVKIRSLEQSSEVFRHEKVKQVADLNLQISEKERLLKAKESNLNSLASELEASKSTATEIDMFLRGYLSEDFDLISWLKGFLKDHKQSQAAGQFEFLSYLCNVYNKLLAKGVDTIQVHDFSKMVHDKFFEHTRTQVSNPKITRYFESSLASLEKEMEIARQSPTDTASGSLRDISIRQQEAMKKKLKKAGKVQRDTVNTTVEHLVLLAELQSQSHIKGVKELLDFRKRQCDAIFTWDQLKTCNLFQLQIPHDPAGTGILGQVVNLKRLAMSLTALLCVSSTVYSCMLSKR